MQTSSKKIQLWNTRAPPQMGPQLDEQQREQLSVILQQYPTMMASQPGCTSFIHHQILVADCQPIRQKLYCLHQTHKEAVIKDLAEMQEIRVIKSSSKWASPLVIITKKDGSMQIWMDFRKLNQLTKFYPRWCLAWMICWMQLGKQKHLTTLDLPKGYWQVPMMEEDKKRQHLYHQADYSYTIWLVYLSLCNNCRTSHWTDQKGTARDISWTPWEEHAFAMLKSMLLSIFMSKDNTLS